MSDFEAKYLAEKDRNQYLQSKYTSLLIEVKEVTGAFERPELVVPTLTNWLKNNEKK